MSLSRKITVALFLALCLASQGRVLSAAAEEGSALSRLLRGIELRGWLRNETAYRLGDSGRLVKTENVARIETILRPHPSAEVNAMGRAIYAPVNLLEEEKGLGARPLDRWKSSNSFEVELREFYLDIFTHLADLRLGKQQVVWGKADGLRVLDVINPQEFREFILGDFIEARIPLWMFKGDFFLGDYTLEALWIPDFETNHSAQAGTEYSAPLFTADPGVQTARLPPAEPSDGIPNSELGLRISRFYRGWDLTVNYFYTWEDDPALFTSLDTSTGTLVIKPGHERVHIAGGTFSNAFGSTVLRGELGYVFDKPFAASSAVSGGVMEKNFINYVIALDYTVHPSLFISGQLFQQVITTSRDEDLLRRRSSVSLSLMVRSDFLHETLMPQVLILWNADDGDYLIRPRVSYQVTDRLKLTLGLDLFGGDRRGFFGRFADKDRIYTGIDYMF